MPRLIVDRFTDDSIAQFRASARIRMKDARTLANSGRGAAAIYLWGYVAEMTLKAAWFALLRHPENQPILVHHLQSAKKLATDTYGIQWPGNLHDLFCWAQLLIRHRIALGRGYANPDFGDEVIAYTRRLYERWRETMRYKKNRAYPSEIKTAAESTAWLLTNSLRL